VSSAASPGLPSAEAIGRAAVSPRSHDTHGPSAKGPRGVRIGDVVVAEHSRWRVADLDPGRRQAVCCLLGGSGVIRRFRARQITRVEKAPTTRPLIVIRTKKQGFYKVVRDGDGNERQSAE
jgi:hypothetical protein